MKVKKQLLRIMIIFISIIAIYNIKGYCNVGGTKRVEIKPGTTAWTNINISNAYAECEALNAATSTLGTTTLGAHLTTDADWSAMAMLSASQYGGANTNQGKQISGTTTYTTNGNNSGIFNIGGKWNFSTGILNTATKNTNTNVSGLFNADGSLKPYMRQWSITRTDNNFVGFKTKAEGGTYGWLNGGQHWGSSVSYPCSIKNGLFTVFIGYDHNIGVINARHGGAEGNATFRPVIWN